MCDLTRFVVSAITKWRHMEHLMKLFMDNFIILFSMVGIIYVDSGSWFKNVFKYMWAALGIIYWPLSHGNYKGVSVEKYHRFLNKTQVIACQYRGMYEVFLHNSKTSNTPGIAPQSTAKIFSEVSLLLVMNMFPVRLWTPTNPLNPEPGQLWYVWVSLACLE